MTNNKKNEKVSRTIIMILNFYVNFNYKKKRKKKKKKTNFSVGLNINMKTSIVMEKLKPGY